MDWNYIHTGLEKMATPVPNGYTCTLEMKAQEDDGRVQGEGWIHGCKGILNEVCITHSHSYLVKGKRRMCMLKWRHGLSWWLPTLSRDLHHSLWNLSSYCNQVDAVNLSISSSQLGKQSPALAYTQLTERTGTLFPVNFNLCASS